jgi:pimeloyl-ACP methyl ester carboxylesterase
VAPDRPVVREWGAGGRPLLFWPGLNPWGELQLVEVGPELARHGFHVLSIAPPIVDDPDAYLPSRLAQYAVSIADERGIGRFVFMGHSWGGSIGVHVAADHPDRVERLVLLDAGYADVELTKTRDELAAEFESEQAAFAFETWDDFFAWVRTRVRRWRPSLEPRYREGMIEREGKIVARPPARIAAWAMHGVAAEPPSATWERIRVPVILLVSSENTRDLEPFRRALTEAQIEIVDSGHDVVEDAPDRVVALVAQPDG